ncbi:MULTISPECIES: hypothetical protein [unclassified Burkholderia]|uniref:hypothetical protein n=1 Tax=unclassified Burkholderia TaxID=2613784 RepID=UPI000A49E04D|nr:MULTISPECIES: hypothetical protein [unclassified Burkholderia]
MYPMMRSPFDTIKLTTANRPRGYFCVGSKKECSVFEEDGAVVVPWDKVEDVIDETEILRLIPARKSDKKKIPDFVRRLRSLRFLQIPVSMLADIEVDCLPKELETLLLTNPKSSVDFEARWDGVESIGGLKFIEFQNEFGSESCREKLLEFRVNNLKLDYLGFDLSKNGNLLNGIAVDNTLKTVVVSDAGDIKLEENLPDGIEEVGVILSGNNFGLDGLSKYVKLRSLLLNGIKSEIDCSVFLSMPSLADLFIVNSKKIRNAEAIASHPLLKRITFINCGKPFKDIAEKFDPSKYEVLDIRHS